METSGFVGYLLVIIWLTLLLLRFRPSAAGFQSVGQISPGLQGTQMNWVDHDGVFLRSNNSDFGFGFTNPQEVTQYFLAIIHLSSRSIVWTANQASPVTTSDKFVFDEKGNVILYHESNVVWSTNTANKGVSALALMDSGNLVLLGSDNAVIWESFAHPTDTLLSNQSFVEGMRLVSKPDSNNLTYFLELKSGDMVLYSGFKTPQPYWSMSKENRKTINKDGGSVISAILTANSWNFHGENDVLLWQFSFSPNTDANATWIAVLGNDGFISFYKLQNGGSGDASSIRIPEDPCGTPEPCGSNFICYSEKKCLCPSILSSRPNCQTGITLPCDKSVEPAELVESQDKIGYFALQFVQPSSKTDLENCKSSCRSNCSCIALFFQESTGGCFLFDEIGGFLNSKNSEFVSYIKLSKNGESRENDDGNGSGKKKPTAAILGIAFSTAIVICGLIYVGIRYVRKKKESPEPPQESSEEENFLEGLSGAPIRYSYKDLQTATDNFSVKLGQGGFGSVYRGFLPDGTRLAVKKLEGIGQGKKEFRAEVGIIGSIHHIHLVRLKGFCAEGTHRLLAYEFMANGSLDKWIFKKNRADLSLDWDTRFNIALGTAKGLAYLHEDCDAKIVHCDIKPENVLLDDNFQAKVSDFGLAKLMNREQSHVFTTLRGTRGYLAPEWITNYAISEKSDVYSYGMVLLEIIGGRKNYDPTESSEKSHFPTYAFKMMEEGRMKAILDAKLNIKENDMKIPNENSAKYGKFLKISLVFWCIAFLFLLFSFTQKPINCPISHRRKTTAVESSQSQPPTNISHLLFGIAGSTKTWKKRQSYCELWWKPNITRGFVWVDEKPNTTWPATSPPYIVSADTSAFSYTCWYGSRSAIRLARIVKESFELGLENVRWFVMGDDDTVFFVENLVNVLGKYDHNQMYYIGSNSESVEQNLIHLYGTAYGGGGYAISYPLAVELVTILDGCLDRYASLYGGDQKVHACVTEIGVPLTKETGFHQVDIRGSQYGLLAAHPMAPLVSLHHVDYLPPIFPTMTQIESLRTLKTAYDLDPGRTLQQSFCYDLARNWSISVSWGYTVQLYPWLATPQDMEKSFQTFETWKSWSDGPFTFNTRPVQSDPCQMPILFFLDPVEGLNRTASSYKRQLEVWEKECGRDEFQLAEKVERFRVVTFGQLFTAAHWIKAPRRECCQVVNGTTSSVGGVDSVVNVHIRPCNPFETMTP